MAEHGWQRCEQELDLWINKTYGLQWRGVVLDGLPWGYGKLLYKSGTEIEGCVQRAEHGVVFHLEGSIQWPDCSRYDGRLKESRPNGYGCCVWVNGNIYSGEWKDGLQDGYGVFYTLTSTMRKMPTVNGSTFAHSVEYEGEWRKNVMEGKGKIRYFEAPDDKCCTAIQGVHERRGRLQRSFTGTFKDGFAIRGKLETQQRTYREVEFEENITSGGFAAWYWSTTDGNGQAHGTTTLLHLNSEEEEYQAVAYQMKDLVRTCRVQIQSIQRVQNNNMRALFELEREASQARAQGRLGAAGYAQETATTALWAFHDPGPQTGTAAPWDSIVQNGFAGLANEDMGRSVAARICFTKNAAHAHKFALHSARQQKQGTKEGFVLRLFMSRILVDVHKGVKDKAYPDIFVIQDNARAYPGYLIEYLLPRSPERVTHALPMQAQCTKAAQLPPGWKAQVDPRSGKTFYRSIYNAIQRAVPTTSAFAHHV